LNTNFQIRKNYFPRFVKYPFLDESQSIVYNSFGISAGRPPAYKELTIQYGHHHERISQQYSDGNKVVDKVWAGACEHITENSQQTTLTYLSGPEGVFALHVKNPNGSENIRYIHTDHLGSWNTITDENGNLLQELSFDAWGNRRNPATWRAFTGTPPEPIFDRGFTGHEHLYGFQLINMNGRMYDPVVSRMLSPDNFIQAPDFSQSFNRYSYCLNNPLVYTDPDGEWIIPALVAGWLLFTESGYEVQKYVSPVAVHVDVKLGTHQTGLGFDVSVGVPKAMPVSYRYNYGKTYYWQTYGDHSGWETRKGGEWTLAGLVNYSGTTFSGVGYPREQTTNTITLGGPFVNLKYENDTYLGNFKLPGVPQGDPYSDGYRTAGARIKVGPLKVGMILHTGDSPSPTGMQQFQDTDGDGIADAWVMTGGDIQDESQSHGIFYVGFGPLRIGRDTEKNRHRFQNKWAHDGFNGGSNGSEYPWVKPFWDRDPRWYFQFWGGTGSTLY
jgi:RHS repeat-associated protein